ncbi:MAG: hypothetical protein EOO30_12980 [Comamonadaceae bacterium]|nr:MAG: hypothetical protein EOO30_12980 [Comamonadaceae bacterium]
MNATALKSFARAKLACLAALAALAAGTVVAGQLSAGVTVKVKLVASSGACGAMSTPPAVHVGCQPPGTPRPPHATPLPPPANGPAGKPTEGGPLLPDAGAVPYQRVGTIRETGVAPQPLPVYSDGTKITSWRVVTLDNARYVELTIAW